MTDTPPEPLNSHGRMRPVAELVHALRFLTRIPVPFSRTMDLPPLSQSMRLFPLAGAMVGAFTGLVLFGLLTVGVPSFLAATLSAAIAILVTGALHEDGLADTADGFGGGKTREHRLTIMRDSRIGTYGTLAVVMAVLARIAAFESLAGLPFLVLIGTLASTGAFSRALMVDLMWATRPARSDGLSVHAGTPGRNGAAFAILFSAAMTLGFSSLSDPVAGLMALAFGLVVTAYIRHLSVKLIGGQTGDVCGAVQVVSEIAMLTAFVAMID